MQLVVDASNILEGGGLTHLQELLRGDAAMEAGFARVYVHGSEPTLRCIPDHDWLEKIGHPLLSRGLPARILWRRRHLPKFAGRHSALVFTPGGGSVESPFVTMCQNLLPLDRDLVRRYYPSADWLRLRALRPLHLKAYSAAAGVIFLNDFSRRQVERLLARPVKRSTIVPHGVAERFRRRVINPDGGPFTEQRPLKLLYVSTVDLYKNHWVVAEAVCRLVLDGLAVKATFVGRVHPMAKSRLSGVLARYPGQAESVVTLGARAYGELHDVYRTHDAFIFASLCESFGMVVFEAMAAGLPVASSNRSSLAEGVGGAALLFDPDSVDDVMRVIRMLYSNVCLRASLIRKGHRLVENMTWLGASQATFRFLAGVCTEVGLSEA